MLVSQAKSVVIAFLAVAPFCFAQTFPAFNWIQEVDGSARDTFAGIGTDAQGNVYVVGSTSSATFPVKAAAQDHLAGYLGNCYVTKLDPAGNIVYSTYFGGIGGDTATAMAVDAAGSVYVTGTTNSVNFPTTKGAYLAPVGALGLPGLPFPLNASFVFKLNPDGTVGYSTYFTASSTTALQAAIPQAIAVDSYGAVTIAGESYGGLPITSGAYHSFCCNAPPAGTGGIGLGPGFIPPVGAAFVTKFDSMGSGLVYSTYLDSGHPYGATPVLALAPDGSAYVSDQFGLYHLDATGSTMLAANPNLVTGGTQALALAADGTLYLTGSYYLPKPTAGAFQTPQGSFPEVILRLDPQLQNIVAGTYVSGQINSLVVDKEGNVYAGGSTGARLTTRTPMYIGFGAGFLSELPGDLSALLFSSYYGADQNFNVQNVAVGLNGRILIGGVDANNDELPATGNIWLNSLALTPPPALRIDSIQNAASLTNVPASGGETIIVQGAGFGSDAQLLIGGAAIPTISVSPGVIVATVPAGLSGNYAVVEVVSEGASSNQVVIQAAPTSPGLFSADGTGSGQGYVLNQDGTVNSPSNPAAPGSRITVFATGVGPISFDHGYAVAAFPQDLFIDGVYCDGVDAFLGPVAGLVGNVYQLTVLVPSPSRFQLPPVDSLVLKMNGARSQDNLTIAIAQ
jgi:uncharacterized protein (TIGR03437 family)